MTFPRNLSRNDLRVIFSIVMIIKFCAFVGGCKHNSISGLPTAEFRIFHTANMLGQYWPTTAKFENCAPDNDDENCNGGFVALSAYMENEIASSKNISTVEFLAFNTGNNFGGSSNIDLVNETITADLINELQFTAMGLGIYDFEKGMETLAKYLKLINVPVVCSNMIIKPSSPLWHLPRNQRIRKKQTLIRSKLSIGVVAYITRESDLIGNISDVEFEDELVAIKREVYKLRKVGVHTIIALSQSTIDIDRKIAKNVPYISIILGGHYGPKFQNLYLDDSPKMHSIISDFVEFESSPPEKKIPVFFTHPSTKKLNIIQISYYLDATINNYTHEHIPAKKYSMDFIKNLNNSLRIHKWLMECWNKVEIKLQTAIAINKISMKSDHCHITHCHLSEMLLYTIIDHYQFKNYGQFWTDCTIAVVGSHIFKNELQSNKSVITRRAVLRSIKRQNLFKVRILGKDLYKAIRMSMNQSLASDNSNMLHFIGLKFQFDFDKPFEKNPTTVTYLCTACTIQKYNPIQPNDYLLILITDFLLQYVDNPYYNIFGTLTTNWEFQNIHTVACLCDYLIQVEYVVMENEEFMSLYKNKTKLTDSEYLTLRNNSQLLNNGPMIRMSYCVFFFCVPLIWMKQY